MLTRASGLIVAAGLGIAIWTGLGCGIARADSTESGTSGSDSATSQGAGAATEKSTTASSPRDPDDDPEPSAEPSDDVADEAEQDAVESDDDDDVAETDENDEADDGEIGEDEADTEDADPRPKSSTAKSQSDNVDRSEPDTGITPVVAEQPQPEPEPENDAEPITAPEEETVEVALQPAEDTVVLAPQPAQTDDVPTDRPARTGTGVVTKLVAAVLSPLSAAGDEPDAPIGTPAEWTLLAAARREITPAATQVANAATPIVATAVEDSLPADWESQYIGKPTLIHQLVVTALRIVDFVVKPFGGLLAFTSLKVPLFTDGIPPFFFRYGLNVERSEFEGTPVWTLQPRNPSGKYIVALHGGAYVAEASLFHWWTYTDMARDTGATVVVPLYPLVPDGGTAGVVVPQTADYLEVLIAQHGAENVSVIGDSAGGGIALAAVQELVQRGSAVPARMVLFAPWLDATVSDPLSSRLDPGDPLLDVPNLVRAGQDWGGELGAAHRYASPLYGSMEGLPPTAVYSGSLDLLTSDTLRLQQLVAENGYDNFTFDLRRGLLHDWAIFGFLPDAQAVRSSVYRDLLGAPEPVVSPATFTNAVGDSYGKVLKRELRARLAT